MQAIVRARIIAHGSKSRYDQKPRQREPDSAAPLLFEDTRDRLLEVRERLLRDFPEYGEIDSHVIVDEDVSHSGNATPIDHWVLSAKFGRKPFGRLADDLKLAHGRVVEKPLRKKPFSPNVGACLNLGDRIANVPKIDSIVVHSGVALRSTSSRMYGLIAASVTT